MGKVKFSMSAAKHKPFRGVLTDVCYHRESPGGEYATGTVLHYANKRGYQGEPYEGALMYTSLIVRKGSFKGLKYIETLNSLYIVEDAKP